MRNIVLPATDVEWPDERDTYQPRHRSDVGRTSVPAVRSRRVGRHDERYTGRDTLDDWKARHGLPFALHMPEVAR
jgi:hypothetical protein